MPQQDPLAEIRMHFTKFMRPYWKGEYLRDNTLWQAYARKKASKRALAMLQAEWDLPKVADENELYQSVVRKYTSQNPVNNMNLTWRQCVLDRGDPALILKMELAWSSRLMRKQDQPAEPAESANPEPKRARLTVKPPKPAEPAEPAKPEPKRARL